MTTEDKLVKIKELLEQYKDLFIFHLGPAKYFIQRLREIVEA